MWDHVGTKDTLCISYARRARTQNSLSSHQDDAEHEVSEQEAGDAPRDEAQGQVVAGGCPLSPGSLGLVGDGSQPSVPFGLEACCGLHIGQQ